MDRVRQAIRALHASGLGGVPGVIVVEVRAVRGEPDNPVVAIEDVKSWHRARLEQQRDQSLHPPGDVASAQGGPPVGHDTPRYGTERAAAPLEVADTTSKE